MFEYNGQTFDLKELCTMMERAMQYAQDHCWCCDKEFEMGEQVVQIPVQQGLYCIDCAKNLMQALVVDAEEVKVEEVEEGEEETKEEFAMAEDNSNSDY